MARCAICDKTTVFGNNVSHSIRRTSRTWKPNLRKVRAIVDGVPKTISVCTRCLRSNKVTRNVRGALKQVAQKPQEQSSAQTVAADLGAAVGVAAEAVAVEAVTVEAIKTPAAETEA